MKWIVGLNGVTYDECTKTYCLIHPYVNNVDIRDLHDSDITIQRVQKYIGRILIVFSFLLRHFNQLIKLELCIETLNLKMCFTTRTHNKFM